jgi:WD40 repeat protein
MRCLLTLLLAAALVLAVRAQPPRPPDFPPLNVNLARLVAASPEMGSPLACVVFHEESVIADSAIWAWASPRRTVADVSLALWVARTPVTVHEGKGLLVAGGEDGSLRLWKASSGKEAIDKDSKGQVLRAHRGVVTSLATAGTTLASGSSDGKVLLWKLPPDKPTHTLTAAGPVRALALSGDGKLLAWGGDDNAVQLADAVTGKATLKLAGPTDGVLAVAVSPDGKTIAAGGYDGKLWAWDAAGKKLFEVPAHAPLPPNAPAPGKNVVSALVFSPDGKQLALGGSDGRAYLFQASDGKFVRQFVGHTGTVTALAFHPAGNLLVSASKDRSVRLWNPQAGNLLRALDGHGAWVEGVALLHRGTRLVSASADQTVRLWDLGAPPRKK